MEMVKRFVLIFVVCIPTLLGDMAFANHGIHAPGYVPSTPLNSVYTLGRFAQFEVGDERGSWSSLEIGGEYAPFDFLSLTAVMPLVRIMPDTGPSASGFGDATMGIRWQAYRADNANFLLLLGLATEVPSGSQTKRMGSGHFELVPHIEMTVKLADSLMLTGGVLYGISMDSSHDHGEHSTDSSTPHGSLFAPHAEQELEARLSVLYMAELGFLEGSVIGAYGFHNPNELGPIDLSMRAGLKLGMGTSVILGFSHTIAGEVRTPWQAQIGFAWLMAENEPNNESAEACGCQPPKPVEPCACAPPEEPEESGCGCGTP